MILGGSKLFHYSWGANNFFVKAMNIFFHHIYYKMNYKMEISFLILCTKVATDKDWRFCHPGERSGPLLKCPEKMFPGGSKQFPCL